MKPITIERWWPYAIAAVMTAVWYFGGAAFPMQPAALLGAAGTAAAVLVGFLATMNAIILSITGSAVFRQLRKAGYSVDLFRYIGEATTVAMTLLVVSLVGFFLVPVTGEMPLIYRVAWVLAAMSALLLFVRVFRIITRLLAKA